VALNSEIQRIIREEIHLQVGEIRNVLDALAPLTSVLGPSKRGPGRPPKVLGATAAAPRRGPGRPRKQPALADAVAPSIDAPPPAKRGPGRPRKQPAAENAAVPSEASAPAKRGPGRPRKQPDASGSIAVAESKPSALERARPRATGKKVCTIVGCGKDVRTKGYCSAHYQKFRNLKLSDRLPSEWIADAAPNSVPDFHLPRGGVRAKAKARKAAKKK
jgi:hypothetical protein